MSLYLLKSERGSYPDTLDAFVVRAKSHREARILAAEKSEDEGEQVWLNAEKSSCTVLKIIGPSKVILSSGVSG